MEKKEETKEEKTPTPQEPPVPRSCRKRSNPDASFIQDVRDHLDEFMSASMEDHKNCFMNTLGKMFGKPAPKQEAASSSSPPIEGVLATTSK
ncbi:uncharacterized protein LOC112349582 [Selaginella moellendorffii]|uniref:uncharacterized protein LOC112349582 n=1 Tax=Selaginella moellendorffii TaxID=88036 RepID=UPI000D1C304E|nr:uncharacterized protein LOC112349582 [Selaginella moellendorffii]XP_024539985.1 uncharacterized protein LOC112349582 [Selaginella moellendorffii]|eukprot:XP_024539984.1 uncharacterized protein LOC112349582 [Selaginella moellendorffii]